MKKLGITITKHARKETDPISPAYPLLAFAYTRSGYIRLAARPARHQK